MGSRPVVVVERKKADGGRKSWRVCVVDRVEALIGAFSEP